MKKERKDKRTEPRNIRAADFNMFENGKLNTRHPERFNYALGYADKLRNTATKRYTSDIVQLKSNNYATTEKYLHS